MEDCTGVLGGGVGYYLDQSPSGVIISKTRPVEPTKIMLDRHAMITFTLSPSNVTEENKIMEKVLPFDGGR